MRLSGRVRRTLAALVALSAHFASAQIPWVEDDGHRGLDDPASPFMQRLARGNTALVDPQAVWIVDGHELTRRSSRIDHTRLPAAWSSESTPTLLASDGDGGAWIARAHRLMHYDATLQADTEVELGAPVQGLAAAGRDALFVAMAGRVARLDARGVVRDAWSSDAIDATAITALQLDGAAGLLWVVTQHEVVQLDAFDHLRVRLRLQVPDARVASLDLPSGDLWVSRSTAVTAYNRAGTALLELQVPRALVDDINSMAVDASANRVWLGDGRGVVELALDRPEWTRVHEAGAAQLAPVAAWMQPMIDASVDLAGRRIVLQITASCRPRACVDDPRYAAATDVRLVLDGVDASSRLWRDDAGNALLALDERESSTAISASVSALDPYGNAVGPTHIDLHAGRARARLKTNLPPIVAITAPLNNAIGVAPASFAITATASDPDGTITKVEFYRSGALLGADATTPYAWSWAAVPVGTYTLTAKAYDNAGASTVSAPVTVQVKSNTPPTVTLASPPNNSTFVAPAAILLSATTGDVDGKVAKVDFLRAGSTLIATLTAAPFSYTWANVAAGTYSLTARATDDKGAITTSAVVTAKVNNPPNVTITAPANNAVVVAPATVTIQASASDSDGTIAKVEFLQNGALLGSDATSPYSFAWANPVPGSYALTARATDNLGATRVSTPVNISVKVNQAPAAALTAPAGDVQRFMGTTLALAASASDPDGTVTKVEFRRNGIVFATDFTAPYTASMTVPYGPSVLTAVATDSKGAQTVSAPITVTGIADQLPVIKLDAPVDLQMFASATPPDIALAASGHDPDGTIVRVRFMTQTTFGDGSQGLPAVIATVTQAPYTALWHAVPPTVNPLYADATSPVAYSVWAEADDDANGTGVSGTANITTPNFSPWAIYIVTPPSGSELAAPATLVVVGTVKRLNNGVGDAIAAVDLVADGAVVASLATANGAQGEYALVWRNAPAGSHGVLLRLTDASGFVVESVPITINVVARDQVPSVRLTAPAAERLVSPSLNPTVQLAAAAADVDGSVARVDFIADGEVIASTAAPYAAGWTSPPIGVHAMHAEATDDRNRVARSPPVFVNAMITERPPVVAMTAPAPGSSVLAGAPITLAADAVAPDGTISRVDFVYGSSNTVIATATTAPYRATWSALAGSYSVRALAYTVAHSSGISTPLTINVTSNSPPVVALSAPLDGQAFAGGLPITLAATASDVDGAIAKVEFLAGSTVIGTSTSAPYRAAWTPTAGGTFVITARATDNAGALTLSNAATITVLPAVAGATITAPGANAIALAGQRLPITVQAVIPGHPLARVDFLADGAAIGSAALTGGTTAAVATFTWAAPNAGTHVIGARAVALDGTSVAAPGVSVTLSDFTVAIAEPFAGQTFLASGEIRISAAPSATSTAVSRVDFIGDGVVLGSAAVAPYVFVWRGMGLGSHRIAVRAMDASGLAVGSSVTVQVVAAPSLGLDAGIDGSSLADDAGAITGTIQAPQGAALVINGQLAALDPQGRFFLENLLLQPGINRIVLSLNTHDAPPVQQTITLNSTGSAPFALDLSPQQGFAPMTATLALRNRTATTYQRVEIDSNDDGKPDQTIVSVAGGEYRIAYTLSAPGLYRMRVTVYDAGGAIVYQARRQTRVYDRAELAGKVLGTYWTMVDRLGANDPAGALRLFTADAQDRYADVFGALGSGIVAIAPQLRRVVDGVVGEDIAEITHARDTPNGPALFMIDLIRGADGLWRIETM